MRRKELLMKRTIIAVVITVVACMVILGGIVLVGLSYRSNPSGGSQQSSGGGKEASDKLQVDPSAGEYVAPVAQESEDGGGIAIPGWGYISIPANETEIEVDFPNPEANDGKYYLSFELRLKDSGEVLYTSGLVPPGKTIQHITLSRGLDEGTHKAVVHVQPYKMDEEQTPTNNADMETDLVVFEK